VSNRAVLDADVHGNHASFSGCAGSIPHMTLSDKPSWRWLGLFNALTEPNVRRTLDDFLGQPIAKCAKESTILPGSWTSASHIVGALKSPRRWYSLVAASCSFWPPGSEGTGR
jgi:hypothetical protein